MRVAHLWMLAALPALVGVAGGEVVMAAEGPQLLGARSLLVAAGQDAELPCRVRHLGDKAVSWVRSRDLQILSHAGAVFTADARVSVAVSAAVGGDTLHTLRLRRLRVADSGRYECQLNTDPKMSLFYNLTVIDEPPPVVEVRALQSVVSGVVGGLATLVCEASYSPPAGSLPRPPLLLRWTKDGQDLAQNVSRAVSLDTERWVSGAVSRLTLAALRTTDAGRYRCGTAHARATVQLKVADESPMEAMQRDQSADNGASPRRRRDVTSALLLAATTRALLRSR